MMIKKIEAFQASDDRRFDTEFDANIHESRLSFRGAFKGKLPSFEYMDNVFEYRVLILQEMLRIKEVLTAEEWDHDFDRNARKQRDDEG